MWINHQGEYIVVDYKATSKDGEVTLDADWQIGYKRQMEIYQWLFRKSGFRVSNTGYFVYCNGNTDKEAFDGRLRSEEHTSELQSRLHLVCRLLLEKKKKKTK